VQTRVHGTNACEKEIRGGGGGGVCHEVNPWREVAAILALMVYPCRGYVLSIVVLRDGVMIRQRLFCTCQKD